MEPLGETAPSVLHSNHEIESAAIAFAIKQEALEGRMAHDTRNRGAVADIVSDDRIIEVKASGTSSRGSEIWLEPKQYHAAKTNPDHFWLDLAENVRQGDPSQFRLLRFGGEQLQSLLSGAKQQQYFTVPLPVATYDMALHEG